MTINKRKYFLFLLFLVNEFIFISGSFGGGEEESINNGSLINADPKDNQLNNGIDPNEGEENEKESRDEEETEKETREEEETEKETREGEDTEKELKGGTTEKETREGEDTEKELKGGTTEKETRGGEDTEKELKGGDTEKETREGENTEKELKGGATEKETRGEEDTEKELKGGDTEKELKGGDTEKESIKEEEIEKESKGEHTNDDKNTSNFVSTIEISNKEINNNENTDIAHVNYESCEDIQPTNGIIEDCTSKSLNDFQRCCYVTINYKYNEFNLCKQVPKDLKTIKNKIKDLENVYEGSESVDIDCYSTFINLSFIYLLIVLSL